MTNNELDERIESQVRAWFGEPVIAVEDEIKQLIRDCIEAVTPEISDYQPFTDSARDTKHGVEYTIETIKSNTDKLLDNK